MSAHKGSVIVPTCKTSMIDMNDVVLVLVEVEQSRRSILEGASSMEAVGKEWNIRECWRRIRWKSYIIVFTP